MFDKVYLQFIGFTHDVMQIVPTSMLQYAGLWLDSIYICAPKFSLYTVTLST